MPAGAHVGVELIFWLGGIATIVFEWLFMNFVYFTYSDQEQIDRGIYGWVRVAFTQFGFLVFLMYVLPQPLFPLISQHLREHLSRAFSTGDTMMKLMTSGYEMFILSVKLVKLTENSQFPSLRPFRASLRRSRQTEKGQTGTAARAGDPEAGEEPTGFPAVDVQGGAGAGRQQLHDAHGGTVDDEGDAGAGRAQGRGRGRGREQLLHDGPHGLDGVLERFNNAAAAEAAVRARGAGFRV